MPSMGQGAADGLQEVLARKFLEIREQTRQREVEQARQDQLAAANQTRQDRLAVDAENTRRWAADFDQRKANADRIADSDQYNRDVALRKQHGEEAALDAILKNPNVSEAAKNLARMNRYGLASNLNIHGLESPDAHAAHVATDAKAEDDRRFEQFKREHTFTENLMRSRPERAIRGALIRDDPTYPAGVQAHVVQIASRHQNLDDALAEFANSIPDHLRAHPNFQPQKAATALRTMFPGTRNPRSAGGSGIDVSAIVAGAGGRGGGSGRPTGNMQTAGPGGAQEQTRTLTSEQIRELATRHRLSTAEAIAKARSLGYQVQ